jgi:hypothetical protein
MNLRAKLVLALFAFVLLVAAIFVVQRRAEARELELYGYVDRWQTGGSKDGRISASQSKATLLFQRSSGDKVVRRKNVLIALGMRGTDVCGVSAYNELIEEGWFRSLSERVNIGRLRVSVHLVNAEAMRRNVELIQFDIDRNVASSFKQQLDASAHMADDGNPGDEDELERGVELAMAVDEVDAVLDVRSASRFSANAEAYAICADAPESRSLVTRLPVRHWLALDTPAEGSLLAYGASYASRQIPIVQVVCAGADERVAIDQARRAIQAFVLLQAGIEDSSFNDDNNNGEQQRYVARRMVRATGEHFAWLDGVIDSVPLRPLRPHVAFAQNNPGSQLSLTVAEHALYLFPLGVAPVHSSARPADRSSNDAAAPPHPPRHATVGALAELDVRRERVRRHRRPL